MGSCARESNATEFVQKYKTRITNLIKEHWADYEVVQVEFVDWPMEDGIAVKIKALHGWEVTLPLVEGDDCGDVRGYWHLIDIEPTPSMQQWLDGEIS